MSEPRPDLSVDEILAEIERRQPQCLWEGETCFQIPGGGYCDMCLLAAAARALRAQQEQETRVLALCHEWDARAFYSNSKSNYAMELRANLASSHRTGSSE